MNQSAPPVNELTALLMYVVGLGIDTANGMAVALPCHAMQQQPAVKAMTTESLSHQNTMSVCLRVQQKGFVYGAGLAGRLGIRQGQGAALVPVLGSLEGPQSENHVGRLALLCTGNHTEPGQS